MSTQTETMGKRERMGWIQEGAFDIAFRLEYSLNYNKVTRFTTPLGYFHDMEMVVIAPDVEAAVRLLREWHDDGVPEGIKATNLGGCIMEPKGKV